MDNFIDVTIPFDKTGFEDNVHDNVYDDLSIIKQMIRITSQISLQEMTDKIGKSKKTVQRVIDANDDIIKVGNAKSVHWEINE